jgi:hypothetical protein
MRLSVTGKLVSIERRVLRIESSGTLEAIRSVRLTLIDCVMRLGSRWSRKSVPNRARFAAESLLTPNSQRMGCRNDPGLCCDRHAQAWAGLRVFVLVESSSEPIRQVAGHHRHHAPPPQRPAMASPSLLTTTTRRHQAPHSETCRSRGHVRGLSRCTHLLLSSKSSYFSTRVSMTIRLSFQPTASKTKTTANMGVHGRGFDPIDIISWPHQPPSAPSRLRLPSQ